MRWIVPLIVLACACSYSFTGSFPSGLRDATVPVFGNETLMYGVEEQVTRAFIDAMAEDGRLRVSSEEDAALRVEGTMTGYRKEPFEYDASGEILTYRVTLRALIGFFEIEGEKYYMEESAFSGWSTYEAGTEEELDGIEGAARNLAQNALIALFQRGF
jgi:hypothetical protein